MAGGRIFPCPASKSTRNEYSCLLKAIKQAAETNYFRNHQSYDERRATLLEVCEDAIDMRTQRNIETNKPNIETLVDGFLSRLREKENAAPQQAHGTPVTQQAQGAPIPQAPGPSAMSQQTQTTPFAQAPSASMSLAHQNTLPSLSPFAQGHHVQSTPAPQVQGHFAQQAPSGSLFLPAQDTSSSTNPAKGQEVESPLASQDDWNLFISGMLGKDNSGTQQAENTLVTQKAENIPATQQAPTAPMSLPEQSTSVTIPQSTPAPTQGSNASPLYQQETSEPVRQPTAAPMPDRNTPGFVFPSPAPVSAEEVKNQPATREQTSLPDVEATAPTSTPSLKRSSATDAKPKVKPESRSAQLLKDLYAMMQTHIDKEKEVHSMMQTYLEQEKERHQAYRQQEISLRLLQDEVKCLRESNQAMHDQSRHNMEIVHRLTAPVATSGDLSRLCAEAARSGEELSLGVSKATSPELGRSVRKRTHEQVAQEVATDNNGQSAGDRSRDESHGLSEPGAKHPRIGDRPRSA